MPGLRRTARGAAAGAHGATRHATGSGALVPGRDAPVCENREEVRDGRPSPASGAQRNVLSPSRDDPIAFALPDITEREVEAVADVIRSRWLTTGPGSANSRRGSRRRSGAERRGTELGTAALHLSSRRSGCADDLVYVPTYTFAACGEVVRYVGATPVLVDVEAETLNLDPDALRARPSSRPTGRGPARGDHARALRRRCLRHGGRSGTSPASSIWPWSRTPRTPSPRVSGSACRFGCRSDIRGTACFSFYATKTITTGEGGMVVTERPRCRRADAAHEPPRPQQAGLEPIRRRQLAVRHRRPRLQVQPDRHGRRAGPGSARARRDDARAPRRDRGSAIRRVRATSAFECLESPRIASAWHLYVLRWPRRGRDGAGRLDRRLNDAGIGTQRALHPTAPAHLLPGESTATRPKTSRSLGAYQRSCPCRSGAR